MRLKIFYGLFPFLGILCMFFSGCQPIVPNTPPVLSSASQTPLPSSTPIQIPLPTKTFTPTVPPTPAATSTPVPVTFEWVATNLQQSGGWDLAEPYSDPLAPELITTTVDGFRLDPGFEVDRIELSYEWWGMGDPVFDYQFIERRNSRFWRGDLGVEAYKVQALIKSISHLYPQPQMLQTITHTDDYPIWAIEMADSDGMPVLLYSNSNGSHYAPWNVIYNGRIYTQFDGQIGNALTSLFEVAEGQPMAWTSEGGAEEGYLVVDTSGWPGQLSDGFSGLLAVKSGFNYWPDPQKGELRGYLQGRSSINGTGNMIIGSITELQRIELDVAENQAISCPIEILPSDDPAAKVWGFVCPVNATVTEGTYRYPIRVTFRTDQDQTYNSKGELFGYWENGTVLPKTLYPAEIGEILSHEPVVQDLMSDHQVVVLSFNAAADPITGTLDHRWAADIALLGQVRLDDQILPYSVTIEVEVVNSKLTHWDLDRSELNNLLSEVLNLAITRQFLVGDPGLILNLYYGGSGDKPLVPRQYLKACADLPTANGLPNPQQPLRGFGFNQALDFSGMQMILLDGGLRLYQLEVRLDFNEGKIWNSLLPVEISSQDASPVKEIWAQPYGPFVFIIWDLKASESDIAAFKALARLWPLNKKIQNWGVEVNPGTIAIKADGTLALISCENP